MVDSSLCKLVAVLRRHVFAMLVASMSSCALCATKVHKIVGMAAPNATFFVWWAKYFECVWGGGWVRMALLIIYGVVLLVGRDGIGWCANGTPYYIW